MKKQTILNVILIVIAISLVPIAFHLNPNSEFQGADGKAEEIINEVDPEYVPWISSFWEPPGAETESLLFALQAAIGAAVVAYGLGYFTGSREKKKGDSH